MWESHSLCLELSKKLKTPGRLLLYPLPLMSERCNIIKLALAIVALKLYLIPPNLLVSKNV